VIPQARLMGKKVIGRLEGEVEESFRGMDDSIDKK
jgi:hypothetical protein